MSPCNIALKEADNSITMRQAQLIWSENKTGKKKNKSMESNRVCIPRWHSDENKPYKTDS